MTPREGGLTAAVLSVLYLALVGSVIAFLLFYWLLQRMDLTKVFLIALVTPVLAVALGAAVLGERLGGRAFVGTAMILGGVFLGVRRPARITSRSRPPSAAS